MIYTILRVNETTKSICDWIQNEIKNGPDNRSQDNLPEMIKALAALITARAAIESKLSAERRLERAPDSESLKHDFGSKKIERAKIAEILYPIGYIGAFQENPNENEVVPGEWEKTSALWKRIK